MDLSRYAFSPVRVGDSHLLRGSGNGLAPVLLLNVEDTSLVHLKRLEHEFELRGELDDAWAVRPVALARNNDGLAMVLEDPGGVPLDRLLDRPLNVAEFLRIATPLAGALRQMHERGLIHKDIKPANVLVDVEGGGVRLTGFGVASRLPHERRTPPAPPEVIAGTLAYMAPEQTGRMNRSIDSRSDLYSLGITFYEMLTGTLPFRAAEPMEWVHCHIARQAVAPNERLPDLPPILSEIVMKLLSKTAEERYQTAAGVESDLRRCLREWQLRGDICDFPLAEEDTPDRLLLPEKLYGRTREIEILLRSFDRVVASGRPELVLVSGYSGIGKSSLVNELHKALVPPRGLFAAGKFDQYKRDIPYASLAQAFTGLIHPLLGKSEAELSKWRVELCDALDPNGALMVDLIPELGLVIGKQPTVPDLAPREAKARFQLVFRRFIAVFARAEHPLALFLDDLQWLDAATLDLLGHLLSHPDVQHLMLIGAYRNNEVSPTHPLMHKLEAIRQTGAIVRDIVLEPLVTEDLNAFIADGLHCELQRAGPLAQLIHEKTAGNPFFAIQFISTLAEEGLLAFEHGTARWSWDLNRIHAMGYTDNVVNLMVGKLRRLPAETLKALEQMACIGNMADVDTLCVASGAAEAQLHTALSQALRLGLILRLEGAYKFIHDRAQEAAYSLIPEALRPEAHLRIGRLLEARTPPENREEAIFEIVNQFNRGAALITSRDEREHLAGLNLIAGKRAKASTAYASALKYLIAGAALLADDCWECRRELAFALEFHRGECEFLTGDLVAASERLAALSSRCANTVEQATVACLRMDVYTALDQSDCAVSICLEYLRSLGVEWSPHPKAADAQREYEQIWSQLASRAIEDLVQLPLIRDPAALASLDVLTKVVPPALFTDANLVSLAICRAVNLSLEHGNSHGSCFAYVWLGVLAGPYFGNYQAGYRFGRLGYELVEQRGLTRFQAGTYMSFASFVMPWTKHVRASRELQRRAFEVANKIGDLNFAAYSCNVLNANLLAAGDPLSEVQRQAENGLEFAQHARFGLVIDTIIPQVGLIKTLRGLTAKFGCFDDGQFDELHFERHLASDPRFAIAECWYWIRKLQARFFAGDYAAAVDASLRAEQLLWTSPGLFETAEYHFYGALSRAACCEPAFLDRDRPHFEALAAHHGQLKIWAENCAENFENRAALVGAEIARLQGRALDAECLYEEAIRSARANGFVHNEALAYELAARFYTSRGFKKIALAYLQDARCQYVRWGATGKVRHLDELHPHLRQDQSVTLPTSTIGTSVEHLDLATVIKIWRAVSGEIVLEKLIDTLMRTAIEHAGAERGVLIVSSGGQQRVEAEAKTSGDRVMVHLRDKSAASATLPESIVQYVVRTHETVTIDDATTQNPFSADEYFREPTARSVLCLPLVKQATLTGVLYLENRLAPHVFTSSRLGVLNLLASQAAVSLENARLYGDLHLENVERKRAEDGLRRSEAYLAEAQRLSHTGSFGWCPASGEIYWSEETFRIFELDRSTALTMELVTLQRVHPDDSANFRQVVERASREGQDFSHEYRLQMPDGRVKHIHVRAQALCNESAGVEFIGSVKDITEEKRAQAERERLEQRLRQSEKMEAVGRVAAGIAHDFNNALAGVFAYGEMVLEEAPDKSPLKRYAQNVLAAASHGRELVEQIRAYSGSQRGARAPFDVVHVVAETLELVRGALPEGIRLESRVPDSSITVIGDATRLRRVVMNLCNNAVQAISGSGILRVALEDAQFPEEKTLFHGTLAPGRYVRLIVTDNGCGMDPETLSRIFEPFFTTKELGHGVGLGLSLVSAFIAESGGAIDVRTAPARGTTFTAYLKHPGVALA